MVATCKCLLGAYWRPPESSRVPSESGRWHAASSLRPALYDRAQSCHTGNVAGSRRLKPAAQWRCWIAHGHLVNTGYVAGSRRLKPAAQWRCWIAHGHLVNTGYVAGSRSLKPAANWRFGLARGHLVSVLCVAALLAVGCPPRREPVPLEPVPQGVAAGIVNDNLLKISSTLNARGRVRGHVTLEDGQRRHFDLAGHLFFLRPRHLSLDLKADLGGSQMLLGSNDTYYWYHNKRQGDSYWCRRYDRLAGGRDPDVPIRPDEIIEALGLTPIPIAEFSQPSRRPMQRIVDEYQQLLFVELNDQGRPRLEKEYWLSRHDPRLVSRIVFRDAIGRVTMASSLTKYDVLGTDGPALPRRIEVVWPLDGSQLTFSVSRWRAVEAVRPDGPQFTPPHQRGLRYDNEMIDDD